MDIDTTLPDAPSSTVAADDKDAKLEKVQKAVEQGLQDVKDIAESAIGMKRPEPRYRLLEQRHTELSTEVSQAMAALREQARLESADFQARAQALDAREQELDARQERLEGQAADQERTARQQSERSSELDERARATDRGAEELDRNLDEFQKMKTAHRQWADNVKLDLQKDLELSRQNMDRVEDLNARTRTLVGVARHKEYAFREDQADLRDQVRRTQALISEDVKRVVDQSWEHLQNLPTTEPASVTAITAGVRDMLVPLLETVTQRSAEDATSVVQQLGLGISAATEQMGAAAQRGLLPAQRELQLLREAMEATSAALQPLQNLQQIHEELQSMAFAINEGTRSALEGMAEAERARQQEHLQTMQGHLSEFRSQMEALTPQQLTTGRSLQSITTSVRALHLSLSVVRRLVVSRTTEGGDAEADDDAETDDVTMTGVVRALE